MRNLTHCLKFDKPARYEVQNNSDNQKDNESQPGEERDRKVENIPDKLSLAFHNVFFSLGIFIRHMLNCSKFSETAVVAKGFPDAFQNMGQKS
jgi:hypothetical protein